jgi:hypothetical protein
VYEWKKTIKVSKPQSGIAYKYFEPTGKINLNSIAEHPAAS